MNLVNNNGFHELDISQPDGCEYCLAKEGIAQMGEPNWHSNTILYMVQNEDEWALVLNDGLVSTGEVINYCPKCGRKL